MDFVRGFGRPKRRGFRDAAGKGPNLLNRGRLVSVALGLRLILTASWAFAADAAIPPVPDYQVGQIAEVDVVTPVALTVLDAEETDRLRQRVAGDAPPVYRYLPTAGEEAVAALRRRLREQRAWFQAALERDYRRSRLNRATVDHPSFTRYVAWLREQNSSLPPVPRLVQAWALGEPDDTLQAELTDRLKTLLARFIVDETPPAGPTPANRARLVPVRQVEAELDLGKAGTRGFECARADLCALPEAQAVLQRGFPSDEQAAARFLAEFVRPNCFLDPALSQQLREGLAAATLATVRYEAGQVIVRRNEVVDTRARAALDALASRRAAGQKRVALAAARWDRVQSGLDRLDEWGARLRARAATLASRDVVVLAVLALLPAGGLWWRSRRHAARRWRTPRPASDPTAYTAVVNPARNETTFLPARRSPPATVTWAAAPTPALPDAPVPAQGGPPTNWREQMSAAEHRAEELMSMVRAGLAPHLARHLADKLVRELMAQRTALLQAHRAAEQEIGVVEARFTTLEKQLCQALDLHERRLRQLQADLAAKTEENRRLLQVLAAAPRPVEADKAAEPASLN
jgi:hypothetical protein